MTLYLVVCTDDNGENQDWFVAATSPEEAVQLWQKDAVDDSTMQPDRIFLVPTAEVTESRILQWHGEVQEVGWAGGE
jgi:hypothetical protein